MSKREDIMVALVAAVSSVPGVIAVERNRTNEIPEGHGQHPRIVIYDGDESVESYALNRPNAPAIVHMTPIVVGHVMGLDGTLGTLTNALLAAVQSAIFNDSTLQGLAQPRGCVQQESVATDIGKGRTGQGSFALTLSILYYFDPTNP